MGYLKRKSATAEDIFQPRICTDLHCFLGFNLHGIRVHPCESVAKRLCEKEISDTDFHGFTRILSFGLHGIRENP